MNRTAAKKLAIIPIVVILLAAFIGAISKRGDIKIIIRNNLAESISIVAVQDTEIKMIVKGNSSERFSYNISQGGIPINLRMEIVGKIVDKEIVDYVERAYHGKVTVIVYRNECGSICIDIDSDVRHGRKFCVGVFRQRSRTAL